MLCAVWGVQLQNATPGQWNVTPVRYRPLFHSPPLIDVKQLSQDIGSAIAMFGLQIVTTVCYTYAVESYISETADVSVFVALVRQVYGFVSPFRTHTRMSPTMTRLHRLDRTFLPAKRLCQPWCRKGIWPLCCTDRFGYDTGDGMQHLGSALARALISEVEQTLRALTTNQEVSLLLYSVCPIVLGIKSSLSLRQS